MGIGVGRGNVGRGMRGVFKCGGGKGRCEGSEMW